MIRYRLSCPKRHEFEAWFPSSEACDDQVSKKLVSCPQCGSAKVKKALMAPHVVTSEQKSRRRTRQSEPLPAPVSDAPGPDTSSPQPMLTGPQREMLRKLKTLRDKVLADAEYVGPRFAEEAKKIHHEEAEGRGIFGEASPAEVEELLNEGIEVLPIPHLPDDHN